MNKLKKILLVLFVIIAVLYIALCGLIYFKQEVMIFHPTKLADDFKFNYADNFEELKVKSFDGKNLSALLFKADSSKGVIFYLHGNGGALNTWGDIATVYTSQNYDLFILDFRGYGKSEGEIYSEQQFFNDAQAAYDFLKEKYAENKIVVIGYSIGTGTAAYIASVNHPKLLILQAPYYSLLDVGKKMYPSITPDCLLKYKFETFKYVEKSNALVMIFHGDADETIYYGSSVKLREHFKQGDELFTFKGQGHGKMNENEEYKIELAKLLSK